MTPKIILISLLLAAVCFNSGLLFASSTQPNLQEMRAQHEIELIKMQKQQQAAIFKKQRDDLLANYKSLLRAKNDAYGQMKISQRDYKTALARLNDSKTQLTNLEGQIGQLQQNSSRVDKKTLQTQIQKLHDAQTKVLDDIQNFTKIQQDSYQDIQSSDAQYRNLNAKEQVLKQQIEGVERQLQFIISQP